MNIANIFNSAVNIYNPETPEEAAEINVIPLAVRALAAITAVGAVYTLARNYEKLPLCIYAWSNNLMPMYRELMAWSNEKRETPEYQSRLIASLKILESKVTRDTNLHLSCYWGRCELTSLPEVIGQLDHVVKLFLDNNDLASLPDTIGHLHNLKELRVNKNKLTSLPNSIRNCHRLKTLDLAKNQFNIVPDSIRELPELGTVYLYGNPIDPLPETIGPLQLGYLGRGHYWRPRVLEPNLPMKSSLFRVRVSELASQPKKVLQDLAALRHPPARIEFLDDKDPPQPYPGVDRGGPKNQFYSDLLKNLFQEGVLFTDFDNGLPTSAHPDSEELRETLPLIGAVLAHMREQGLITGRILPDAFFEILQIVQSNADLSVKQNCLAAILQKPQIQTMLEWLAGDESKREEVLACLEAIREDDETELHPSDDEMSKQESPSIDNTPHTHFAEVLACLETILKDYASDDEMRKQARALIDNTLHPYFAIASSLLSGITGQLAQDLANLSPEEVSRLVQGTPLDADKLIALLDAKFEQNPHVLQKVEWLKERIRVEAQAGTDWMERLLFCVTGQRALTANSAIHITHSKDQRCKSHTCFNALDIPIVEMSKEEFFEQLDLLMADTTFSMA